MPFLTPTTPAFTAIPGYGPANFMLSVSHANGSTALVFVTRPEDSGAVPVSVPDTEEFLQALVDAIAGSPDMTVTEARAYMQAQQEITVTP